MKRITRNRRLTPEEAAKYKDIRQQVADELPELIKRHHERTAADPGGRDYSEHGNTSKQPFDYTMHYFE